MNFLCSKILKGSLINIFSNLVRFLILLLWLALAAAKSQVFGDLLTYSNVGNTVVAPWRMRENIIGDVNPIMAANDHYGGINLIGNGGLESIINKLAQKSVYNESNQTLQYADKMLYYTPRITNEVGEFANFYAVMDGSLGILTRFEREGSFRDKETCDGHVWGIDTLPDSGFPYWNVLL